MSTMMSTDDWTRAFQSHLLAAARERVPGLSSSVRDAFVAVPRHVFVEEYRTLEHPSYRRVFAANLLEHLPALYRDNGLGIFGQDAASGVTAGGLLLFVLKCPGGGDVLLVLRREEDHFRSLFARPCMFVPVTGPTRDRSHDPEPIATLPLWQQLAERRIHTRPLLCGSGRGDFAARTFDVRSFLSIVEPRIRYFLDDGDRDPQAPPWTGCTSFGLCMHDAMSIALARRTSLDTYGNADAGDRMDELLRQWLDLGMPSAAGLDLRAYPSDRAPEHRPGEWAIKRRETCFIWSPRSQS